jgi:hypothetical protein
VTETRRAGRHTAAASTPARPPDGVEPEEVWVPPPFEPVRPGDFVSYASPGWEVKKTHRGLKVVLALILVVALAAGGWLYYVRSHTDAAVDPVAFCQKVDVDTAQATASFVHASVGGHIPAGIPLPEEPAWVQCHVTNGVGTTGEAAVWRSTSRSAYEGLLSAAGWIPSDAGADTTKWVSGTSHHLVATTSVDGYLVALFRD